MKEVMLALKSLQGVDDTVRQYEEEHVEIEQRLTRYQEVTQRMGADLQAKKEELAEAEQLIRQQDIDLKLNKEREQKAKSKLSAAMKTKQYIAAQRELEQLKRTNTLREEDLLKLMEEMEVNRRAIKELDGKFETLTAEISKEQTIFTTRVEELTKEIGSVSNERQALMKQIPKDISRRYDRVKKARGGRAMVPVLNERCSGCNRMIQPQLYNEIQRWKSLESCPHCSRFLYVPSDEEQQLAASLEN